MDEFVHGPATQQTPRDPRLMDGLAGGRRRVSQGLR
jgi:hypothetical protein